MTAFASNGDGDDNNKVKREYIKLYVTYDYQYLLVIIKMVF